MKKNNVVLQIGAGGVGGVVAHKMAMNRDVFKRIILASRTISKCKMIADSIHKKGLGEIEIDAVNADSVESVVALIEKYRPHLVVNVALPYQDLAIMEACLRTKTHYLDTANYEHPDSAHFEYKEQWAYDTLYKQAGIFALLGSGFDPGVTNIFCAYAQKHYFDEIHSIDILDCNAGDHGYAFATNFNPEINLREVSSKARYWVRDDSNSSHTPSSQELEKFSIDRRQALSQSNFSSQPANLKQNPHSLDTDIDSYNKQRIEMNGDMPQGGEYQGVDNGVELYQGVAMQEKNSKILDDKSALCSREQGDKTNMSIGEVSDKFADLSLKDRIYGSGVWNMEQNDPDPFMHELNLQGLPYVVCEIDAKGNAKVLEDGRG